MEEDKRFAHISTDPKFRRIPKTERKVKIDKRFKSMFKDKQFKVKYTIDKRGRPVNHTSNEDLKRYYELSSGESSSESDNENTEEAPGKFVRAPKPSKSESSSDSENENTDKAPGKCVGAPKPSRSESLSESDNENTEKAPGKFVKAPKPSESEDDESDSNQLNLNLIKHKHDDQIPNKVKKKLKNLNIDYARGESALYSESSSDDEESETEDSEDDSFEHLWGELDRDAERCDEITHRLAACNMDWDRIRAVDLMVLLSSFLPPGGLIKSCRIYPSEFGLQRIKEEEIKGPTELVESKPVDNDGHEGSKYHMEKLRQYQLNRLKYYYAVIVCDNENSANKIYTECDGMEYESSATKMDLRFIPDDTVFDEEPKEVCEKLPEQGKYQPRFFTTTALQQAKVDLTWDETNPDRIEITQKLASGNVDDIADGDLQAYLASSSGEEDENDQEQKTNEEFEEETTKINSIDKYKALLHDIENNEKAKHEKDVEMEITWGIDLKGKTERLVRKKLDAKEEKTPFQQYLDKRKEKQKTKREERKKKQENDEDADSESDSDIPSDIDMNDPYFAEEFDKPEFKQRKNKKGNQKVQDGEDLQKKAELELLLLNPDDDDNDKKHFSLQKIQQRENESKSKKKLKNKKKREDADQEKEDNFTVNVGDQRFSALYSSHHFNVDPTDPHYKKTKGMEAIVTEKLKRRIETNNDTGGKKLKTDKFKKDAELSVLVKSVKRKTEALSNKKRK